MHTHRLLISSLVLILLPAVSRASAPHQDTAASRPASETSIAILDFAGSNRQMNHLIASTLWTTLSHSDQIHVVARSEVRQALDDLDVEPGDALSNSQLRRLGRTLHADRLLTGDYRINDEEITIRTRLLEADTGARVPDATFSETGDQGDLRTLTRHLADKIRDRLQQDDNSTDRADDNAPDSRTEEDAPKPPLPDNADSDNADPQPPPPAREAPREAPRDILAPLQEDGLVPNNARPGGFVPERDLAVLIRKVARRMHAQNVKALSQMDPEAPVSRLRALTALVRLAVPRDEITSFRDTSRREMCPDANQIPLWGQSYVAAAIDQGWWPADQPLHARANATWGFVGELLIHMPLDAQRTAPRDEGDDFENVHYTGLLIDARDLALERTMSPRILDEDGNVLYPNPGHVPSIDYLEDRGMASYDSSEESARRAGSHPLVARAMDVAGAGHDDLVVSNETAARIRAADRRNRFLSRWAVSILVDSSN